MVAGKYTAIHKNNLLITDPPNTFKYILQFGQNMCYHCDIFKSEVCNFYVLVEPTVFKQVSKTWLLTVPTD